MRTMPLPNPVAAMDRRVLTQDELARALDELAEIVDIICAPILPPRPSPHAPPARSR